ncbi:MAG TPA: hypothetical protein VJZ77_01480, partial [Blastocatellia bacterium]|nr:hypothetical protein [Blastocatellia bacterium]
NEKRRGLFLSPSPRRPVAPSLCLCGNSDLPDRFGGGKWFIKFIHMTKLNETNLDYESKWASLTFEIR